MTSLIRGFDQSLRDSIGQLGPNTIMVQIMAEALGVPAALVELVAGDTDRTIGQAAIAGILANPAIASVLPPSQMTYCRFG